VNTTKAATTAGFVLCAASLAAGQAAIGRLATLGADLGAGFAQDLGYTFTGLTAVLGYALWRWGRAEALAEQTNLRQWRNRLLQAVVASIPVLFGCLYYSVAGQGVELHARTFAALPPLAYLLAVVDLLRPSKRG